MQEPRALPQVRPVQRLRAESEELPGREDPGSDQSVRGTLHKQEAYWWGGEMEEVKTWERGRQEERLQGWQPRVCSACSIRLMLVPASGAPSFFF